MSWTALKSRYNAINNEFYAVIDPDGVWADSTEQFHTAIHFAAMDAGRSDIAYNTIEKQLQWMSTSGYSIVHSSLLPAMAEAELIS